jgi:hypothetical protein
MNLEFNRDRLFVYSIVVVLETKVYVYNFVDLGLLDSIPTISNPKGFIIERFFKILEKKTHTHSIIQSNN